MRRAVTAIYRSYDVAALVRDELERIGLGRRHIRIIPNEERGTSTTTAGSVRPGGVASPAANTTGSAGAAMPPGAYAGAVPGYDVVGAAYLYSEADTPYGDAFDDLHDLHLPEADTRVYQQAIRNGDYVVSVDVDNDADLARIQEIMRRPEDAYDLDELDTRYGSADYAPRRQPMREGYDDSMLGQRDDAQSSPYSRYYSRDKPR